MATFRTAGIPTDGGAVDLEQVGPTVLRLLVGTRLRQLRETAGISREQAAAATGSSVSKITRLELGRGWAKPSYVDDLLALYGVVSGTERATLLAMAEQAGVPGWWSAYSDVIPHWFEPYLGMEQGAKIIRTFEVQVVPGLLQTAEYARAVIRLGHLRAPKGEIDRRVRLRMRRQEILHAPDGPALWAVIDEAALRRPIGGLATMRAQLRHLIEIAELPNVTIQVVPFNAGGHPAIGGPITILRFPASQLPDMVYLEQINSAIYPDKPGDTQYYWHIMNQLVIKALPPRASIAFLHRVLKQT